ncbi:hypothetical protein ACWIWK_01390 [Helicobacter sp. 23-1048]
MDLDAPHISSNGEIISKRELIGEIENLLNGVGSHKDAPARSSALSQTTLSTQIMATLSFEELLGLRDSILQKDSLEANKDWLLNLSQKP